MNFVHRFVPSFLLVVGLINPAHGAVLLDEDWDDGDRTDTNLPDESAWFANSVGGTPTLTAAAGTLVGNVLMFETNTSSRLWITHFTPTGSPVELALGETLKATLTFSASNVTTSPATSRGLRFGLFNFSEPGAARVNADGFSTGGGGGAPGANVTGYLLNMNFAQSLSSSPLQIMKRTDTPNINLMGASAVYTGISSGGGATAGTGFSNGITYTLEFLVRRLESSVEITTKLSEAEGWSVAHTAQDFTISTFRFDGFAIRPNSMMDVAESFAFSGFKVELVPYELRVTASHYRLPEGMTITWNAEPGRTYQIEWRASLDTTDSWTLLNTVTASESSTSFTDLDAVFETRRFYRVVALP